MNSQSRVLRKDRRWMFGFFIGVLSAFVSFAAFHFIYSYYFKPSWDKSSISASYEATNAVGSKGNIVFYYIIENKSQNDFSVYDRSSIEVMAVLKNSNSFTNGGNDMLSVELPIYIPAGHKQRVAIGLGDPYTFNGPNDKSSRAEYVKKLEEYVRGEFPNLDGFILFDKINRYEIRLPSGWEKQDS